MRRGQLWEELPEHLALHNGLKVLGPWVGAGRVGLWDTPPAAPSYLLGLSLKVFCSERLSLTPSDQPWPLVSRPHISSVALHTARTHVTYLSLYFMVYLSPTWLYAP